MARRTSPDGRWAYTLYDGTGEPFVQALDTVGRTAGLRSAELVVTPARTPGDGVPWLPLAAAELVAVLGAARASVSALQHRAAARSGLFGTPRVEE